MAVDVSYTPYVHIVHKCLFMASHASWLTCDAALRIQDRFVHARLEDGGAVRL